MSYNKELFNRLIGDFYESNSVNDTTRLLASVKELENAISSNEITGEDFLNYYNDVYAGRAAYNAFINIADYPAESVVRELLQNIFDCYYDTKDIKLAINFKEDGFISFAYNEIGFTLEQFMYYLSFGRNSGDCTREGRFGIGSKSVFMNTLQVSMRSGGIRFKIKCNDGQLKIDTILFNQPHFKGTEIIIKVEEASYYKIKNNFLNITSKRHDYINVPELCFAFNHKKIINSSVSAEEEKDRTFNIAVLLSGKLEVIYKINKYYLLDGSEIIQFLKNHKSFLELLKYEYSGIIFLVPYFISEKNKLSADAITKAGYNYFSTYELTGRFRTENVDTPAQIQKLSAFFISVPNYYVTPYRTGIRHDSEFELSEKIAKGISTFITEYKKFFVINIVPIYSESTNSENSQEIAVFSPEYYMFDYVQKFVQSGRFETPIAKLFSESISIRFPDGSVVPYLTLKQYSYSERSINIPFSMHESGEAYSEYIEKELNMQEKLLLKNSKDKLQNSTISASYEYLEKDATLPLKAFSGKAPSSGNFLSAGTVFKYKFFHENKIYIVSSSHENPKDYDISLGFEGIAGHYLEKIVSDGKLRDEDMLFEVFEIFDSLYGNDYRLYMKYYQFNILHGDKQYTFEVPHMKIKNLKKAMDIITSHQNIFDSYQTFSEVSSMFVNIFTEGKETSDFIYELKSQGVKISLRQDLNGRPCFSFYNNLYPITENIKSSKLAEIIGDMGSIVRSKVLIGKVFDFKYFPIPYAFDPADTVAAFARIKVLPQNTLIDSSNESDVYSEEISSNDYNEKIPYNAMVNEDTAANVINKIYNCDMQLPYAAILDERDVILNIVCFSPQKSFSIQPLENTSPYIEAGKILFHIGSSHTASKIVLLSSDISKEEIADILEITLTGSNNGILQRSIKGIENPTPWLFDQIPYYLKLSPAVSRNEFLYLRGVIRNIQHFKNEKAYINYFIKDVNQKLFGYGFDCPVCEKQAYSLSGFVIREFKISVLSDNKEKFFRFSLFMCLDDFTSADSWVIQNLTLGGLPPFVWLNEVTRASVILPEFFICRFKINIHSTYEIPARDSFFPFNSPVAFRDFDVEVFLSPMLCAKIIEDNFLNR